MKFYKYVRAGDDRMAEGGRRGQYEEEEGVGFRERMGGGGAKGEWRGGAGLTEVDCPVCVCRVLRDPVACGVFFVCPFSVVVCVCR